MNFSKPINRRIFMKGAGTAVASLATASPFAGELLSEDIFASAFRHEDGHYGVLLFDETGREISRIRLPDRGHDIAFSEDCEWGVVFSRRPGNLALAFDPANRKEPLTITAPAGRHYYGHGVFSFDGKLLYATENNFEDAEGVIGIYDATNAFSRIGEFSSFGTGPHEILLHSNKKILVVANGGIETHPDFGRAKLNLATMKPSLVFIDAESGTMLEEHVLPDTMHRLSIRHMDISHKGRIVFGCQNEGPQTDWLPLIGSAALGEKITLCKTPVPDLMNFGQYVGSIAISNDQMHAAATLPKGNRVAILDTKTGSLVRVLKHRRSFGVSQFGGGFLFTTETGKLATSDREEERQMDRLAFDNHLSGGRMVR